MIKDIEFKANELLSTYCEAKNSSIKTPVDPIDVLEFKGFSVDYVNDKYALNIYGALQVDRKVVEVNADVKINEGMENFTIAHELGHIVLHVPKMDKNKMTECAYEYRKDFGKELAKEADIDVDLIVPVPDSGNAAAIGYSQYVEKKFDLGLIRNG